MILVPGRRPAWSRYVIAVVAVALAVVLRAWLLAPLGTRSPFVTFYPAVILAALGGGLPGGLLATALSTLAASFGWIEPVGQFLVRDPADWLAVITFVLSSTAISWVAQAMHRAQVRAGEAEAQVKLTMERSLAEEKLRRYKLLAEHSRDIILCVRRDDGRILEANDAAAKAYGYTREELQSLSIQELRAPDARRLTESQMATADSAGILFQTVHQRKDGSRFPVEVSSQGANIDGTRTLISVVRDITRRKRVAEELRQQREWLRVTLTSIGDAVLATGADGKITFLNPVAAQLTGWNENQALGRPIQDVFRIINEQTREPAEDIAGRVLREGLAASLADRTALVTRDGSEVPIEDSAAPIRDASGRVVGVVIVFHDVTEKRREQEDLRAERERLRVALDASNAGTWEWDPRTNEGFWSEELWKIYGLEPDSCTPSYEAWRQIVIPEDRTMTEQAVQYAARNGADLNVEFRVRGRDGAERWLMARARPRRDADGQTVRYVGIAVDITERKRAEAALRESESRLRTLSDNLPDGAIYQYRLDVNGEPHVDFISAGIERLTGVPAAEYMGDAATVERNIVPEDHDRLHAAIALSLEKLARFEVLVRHKHRKTGETRWSLLRSTPSRCPDGSTVWNGIELDITDRRQAEEALRATEQALRESEVRYRRLVDLAPEAIVVQQGGTIVYCNDAAAELYGAETRERLVGTGMFDRVHPGDLPIVLERIREAERGARLPVREVRHLKLDGSEVAVETTAGRAEWHGQPAMLVFVRDITGRKRAEERLRQAQKFESLGVLAGGVAHDFNNLLVGVLGNASLAKEFLPSGNPAGELLEGIVRTGEELAHLTRQMLAYSGKGQFLIEPLNLSLVVSEMNSLAQKSISKKVPLRLVLDHDLPSVQADRGQLQQVIMNLVLNAAEAVGGGEGLILVRTGIRTVDDHYVRSHPEAAELRFGEYVFLEVRDTGCGMDEATQARAFDPFFSTKFLGRGLGLAAVAGIVRGHKGAIAVSSAPGKGSTFTVLFPATGSAPTAAPVSAVRDSLLGSGTVLVVDDEEVVRTMAKRALELYGYQVLAVESGVAAINLLKRHTGEIAAVILDLSMPGMSGDETLRELRRIRPGVKVLISSGYSEAEAMRLFGGQQVSGFIQKPYTATGIAEKLKAGIG